MTANAQRFQKKDTSPKLTTSTPEAEISEAFDQNLLSTLFPKRNSYIPVSLTAPQVFHLQRTIGNAATRRLLTQNHGIPPVSGGRLQRMKIRFEGDDID